ncbi:MAG: hypothetical protein EOO41_03065 [Methanobacteriota archaeon]|nr:MAG: hypothetical protein EOO41_03065 [Euryarchaeota archaeon]
MKPLEPAAAALSTLCSAVATMRTLSFSGSLPTSAPLPPPMLLLRLASLLARVAKAQTCIALLDESTKPRASAFITASSAADALVVALALLPALTGGAALARLGMDVALPAGACAWLLLLAFA